MTPPVEQTKYPLDHNVRLCCAQKTLPNLSKKADADFAFNFPISDDKQTVGGVSNRKWIWSSSPLISNILQSIFSASLCMMSNKNGLLSTVRI